MLAEEFFSSICGPPLSSNTSISKDIGIYAHSLWPTYAAKSTFKKSSTPVNCLAVSDSHVFAAQYEKGHVHVYSRIRGNQEAFVPFPERIKCLTLAGDGHVLVVGTVEGRIMLWETCTGRLVSTPPCHVQAVSCVVATPHHLLTGSDDSNVHVWSLAQLLELDSTQEHEPIRTFSNHRGAITDIVATQGTNPDTSLCVSASKDKTCIIWNHQTGAVLRTLLFPTSPLCLALDPCSRALFASTEDRSIFSLEFFGPKPLLGPQGEQESSVVQVTSPFGAAPPESGPASCLALTFDGTSLLSGHAKGQIHVWSLVGDGANNSTRDVANLNAAVTNLVFVPPLLATKPTKAHTIIKPSQAQRAYIFTSQFEGDLVPETRFGSMLKKAGFSNELLEDAILSFQQSGGAGDQELQRQIEEQWEIINQQKLLHKETVEKLTAAQASR